MDLFYIDNYVIPVHFQAPNFFNQNVLFYMAMVFENWHFPLHSTWHPYVFGYCCLLD